MQIKPQQLRSHLKQGIQPVYLVVGEEPLQIRESIDMIRKAARYYGYEERQYFHADHQFDWNELAQASQALSLFSHRRLLDLYLASGKPGDKGAKQLLDYLEQPPADTVLLIFSYSWESQSKKTRWYKALLKNAVVVISYPLKEMQLKQWLAVRMQEYGLSCDKEALDYFAAEVQGNMLAADQEIVKLSLYYQTDRSHHLSLDLARLSKHIDQQSKYNAFELFDTMLLGKTERVYQMIEQFQQQGVAIIWLLFVLTKEFRQMLQLLAMARQMPIAQVVTRVWIFPQRKALIQSALQSQAVQQADWGGCLQQLADIDRQCRGISRGNPWLALQLLLVRLSRHLNNGAKGNF